MSSSSTPVAKGSSVPAWATFVPRGRRRFTESTARAEVMPAGLSSTSTPFILGNDKGSDDCEHRCVPKLLLIGDCCVIGGKRREHHAPITNQQILNCATLSNAVTLPSMIWTKPRIAAELKRLHKSGTDLSYNGLARKRQAL